MGKSYHFLSSSRLFLWHVEYEPSCWWSIWNISSGTACHTIFFRRWFNSIFSFHPRISKCRQGHYKNCFLSIAYLALKPINISWRDGAGEKRQSQNIILLINYIQVVMFHFNKLLPKPPNLVNVSVGWSDSSFAFSQRKNKWKSINKFSFHMAGYFFGNIKHVLKMVFNTWV